jgi:hypothetical protein
MKSINKVLSAAVVTAALGGGMLLAASPAFAAAPAWEPDVNGNGGTISFYNAAGVQVTSGTDLSHLFDYAVASTAENPAGFHKANLSFAYPNHSLPTSGWFVNGATVATTYPVASAPGALAGVAANIPVSHPGATEMNLTAALGGAVLDTTAGYANIVQIRLAQSSGANQYWTGDIQYNSTANTWTQVFPTVVTATTTTLTATPNPAITGSTVTLNAAVSPSGAAGTVQFKDGGSNIGAPVTVTGGAASIPTSTLAAGSHSLSAVFTPTDPTSFGGSTGTFTEQVNPPATPTTTTLAVSGGYLTAGSSATLTASVTGPGSTANGSGTVAFYDNGSATAVPGTVTTGPTGTYTLTVDSGFSAGSHSIVAKFAPTDVNVYQASQSAPQSFLTQAAQVGACAQPGSVCTDTQNVTATVPVGTLVINTPYTAAAPLDLGTLVLDPTTSATLTGTAAFEHIVVTDTRSGNLPWTVQAVASNLSDGGSNPNSVINAQNLGLDGLAQTSSGTGFTGTLTYTNRPAANGVAPGAPGSAGLGGGLPQTIITTDHGLGTVDIHGTLTLIAPSSTEPGTFAGTITFTVG